MTLYKIDDISDSRVDLFRNIKSTRTLLLEQGKTVCEGLILFEQAILTKVSIDFILTTEELFKQHKTSISHNTEVFLADKDIINKIAGYKLRKPLLFVYRYSALSIKEISTQNNILFLNGVINFENVGSIIRNAIAFGFNNIIYDSKTCTPFYSRSIVVSRGSLFHAKVAKANNTSSETIRYFKQIGYKIISIEISKNSIPINLFTENLNTKDKHIFVFGSEGEGVDLDILQLSDYVVHIPMDLTINSINVAASSAIILYILSKTIDFS